MLVSATVVIGLFSVNFAWSYKYCGDDCVPMRDCLEVKEYYGKLTLDNVLRVRQSYCGHSKINGTQICCIDFKMDQVPKQKSRFGIEDAVPPVTTSTTTTTPKPEVKEHPNMKLLPDNCGDIEEDRIIHGEIAAMYEFPWMALISYEMGRDRQFLCSGALINSKYVLTAAHCVYGMSPIVGVRVGEYDIRESIDCQNNVCETKIQDRRVAEMIVHEKYTGYPLYKNDIALLRLTPSIDMKYKNSGAICLPVTQELRNATIENEIGEVAGWGLTEFNRESSVLLKVKVPIRSMKECEEFYSHLSNPNNTQFCAGQPNQDSCRGDSGGPLFFAGTYKGYMKYVQFGIVSNGPLRCGSETPGIYTDVRKYVDWILDHIHE